MPVSKNSLFFVVIVANSIDVDSSHNEHLIPQRTDARRTLDFDNKYPCICFSVFHRDMPLIFMDFILRNICSGTYYHTGLLPNVLIYGVNFQQIL